MSTWNDHRLTRRDMLKWLGLSAGAVLVGPVSGCAELWERQSVIEVEGWHPGVCRFCGTGCHMEIGVKGGKVVDVKGREDAHNRGRLCIKGAMNREILETEGRATTPMIRRNGRLEPASWEEAMSLVADRFKAAIAEKGPDAVAFYGSGQLYTQESYTANKLFKAGIRTNNVDGNPRLCMASAGAGYVSVYGKDEPYGCYNDIDHADCLFITGSNTADCHPIIWERVLDRKRSHPDTLIIVVDPRRTRTAGHADMHLPIRPGTDIALYNAMMYEFVRQGFIDQEMVDRYLKFREGTAERDFAAFKAHLEAYSPDQVAETCGISATLIREAAFRFASAKATTSLWTMGLNQQTQGTAANRLVNAMHLLTGHAGRKGATPLSITGQPNAGGGVRDTGALADRLPAGRLVANAQHRREIEEQWGLSPGTISPKPGLHAKALFEAMNRGDVAVCLVMATNPAQTMPNLHHYEAGLRKTFLVVADAYVDTETTRYADVLLPAAMWAEKGGVCSNTDRRYHLVPKLVEAPGEAKSDLEILVDLALRLGHGELIKARTMEDVWEEWRLLSKQSKYDFSGITYERLKKEPGLRWPCPTPDHPGAWMRYVPGEDPLAHGSGRFDFYGQPDGRAIIFLETQEPPKDPVSAEFPLVLTTGRVLEHWHTMTITGRVPELQAIRVDFLQIHPSDARARGIEDGAPVTVRSRRGSADFVARVTDVVPPGLVFTTFHSSQHLINRVTTDAIDPFSKQPEYKVAAVEVRGAAHA